MSDEDKKAAHKVDEMGGKAKEGLGKALGNESMEAEGKADQSKASLKQAGDKVKDAVKPSKPSKDS